MYSVIDAQGRVRGTYKTLAAANRRKDKLDNEYGCYHYSVVRVS